MCSKLLTPLGATSAPPGGGDGSLSSRPASYPPERKGGSCGGNPLTGETRPPGLSRGRVVNSHATPL